MATRAQREAHRRYALKVVVELTDPVHWAYDEIAAVLTQQEVFTPLGTTDWDSRLVAALLIWDAFCEPDSTEFSGLIGTIGSFSEATREFEGLSYDTCEKSLRKKALRAVEHANEVLHGEDLTIEGFSPLPPAHQAAYRDYALDVLKGLAEGPWTYGDMATVLTRRAIPTLDGQTKWHPIQVQRLLNTSGDRHFSSQFVSTMHRYTELEHLEEEEKREDGEGEIPF